MLILQIVLPTACVIALLVLVAVRRYRRNKPIRNWMAKYRGIQVYNGDLLKLPPAPEGPWDNDPEVLAAKQAVQEARKVDEARRQRAEEQRAERRRVLEARLAKMRKRVEGLRVTEPTDADYQELLSLKSEPLDKDDKEWVTSKINELADRRVDALLTHARAGDREAFTGLRSYVCTSYSNYKRDTGAKFAFPSDWDDLMVSFIANPQLGDFEVTRTDLAPGECRLLAAEALRTDSLLRAKLVLALCNKKNSYSDRHANHSWRNEIGCVLLAEVTKMVDRRNVQIGMPSVNTTK